MLRVGSGGAERALQPFSEYILQHRLIQRQFCHQLFQLRIILSRLLDLANLIHFQASVLRLPTLVRLPCDFGLADQLGHRYTYLGLLQN